jgi:hypothetical protein
VAVGVGVGADASPDWEPPPQREEYTPATDVTAAGLSEFTLEMQEKQAEATVSPVAEDQFTRARWTIPKTTKAGCGVRSAACGQEVE